MNKGHAKHHHHHHDPGFESESFDIDAAGSATTSDLVPSTDPGIAVPGAVPSPLQSGSYKAEVIADVKFFFDTPEKSTGLPSICKLCLRNATTNKAIKVHQYKPGSSITNLRIHLENQHLDEYIKECREQGWVKQYDRLQKRLKLGKKPGDPIVPEVRAAFTKADLINVLVRLVVVNDLPISFVDWPEVRTLLLMNPEISDKDIPHRTKFTHEITKGWQASFEELKDELKNSAGKISCTADVWSDQQRSQYLAITGHWIFQPSPMAKLELKCALLGFSRLLGSHTGENIAKMAMKILDRANIANKIGHWTLDNAANNKTFLDVFQQLCRERGIPFSSNDRRINCFPHTINLCSQKIISTLMNVDSTDDDPTSVDALAGDADGAVSKARSFVKAIRASGQRRDALMDFIKKGNHMGMFQIDGNKVEVPVHQLILDVRTRWDSTYYMVKRFRELEPAIDLFLASCGWQDSERFRLSKEESCQLYDCELLLSIPHEVQMRLAEEKNPVLSYVVPSFEIFMSTWEKVADKLPHLEANVEAGLNVAKKYYTRMDDTKAYVIAMFINPAIRMSWVHQHWDQSYIDDATDSIKSTMAEYRISQIPPPQVNIPLPKATIAASFLREHGLADMQIGGSNQRDKSIDQEYQEYIGQGSEIGMDILAFWAINARTFPTIFEIAKDYLPIQASSVPCERVFSSSAETDVKRRNRISPALMEILQLYKFKLRKARVDFSVGIQEADIEEEPEFVDYIGLLAAVVRDDTPANILTTTMDQLLQVVLGESAVESGGELDD